ncbi:hypothetical protein SAMN05443287_105264 [Micromonospora phaseoli]|uniref:Uncharacterized protein n=1 Tax=Micromonospora phaseoli TaxID=1144548 RepID=A0A1H7A393_9ACTN|nr:hypothetical protein [Micromonospora phaseoli]PZV97040.1 hypothetical protein CLV64_106148 [Micromonospora phaseoli]GIJ77382.1 hypothetical protein Xph01_18140 [Micromonospora phaseoli]SEJ56330.1 hypothetical protein SAMN05443287_105264 [Micromonospora phaseoli]
MRYRPILPAAAGTLAVVHVVGILTGLPLLREAEVAALLLLSAYALTARPSPRPWGVPVALAVLVVDAWITMQADPAVRSWQVLRPGSVDLTTGFATGLRLTWACLVLVLVLVVTERRHAARPGLRVIGGAVLAAVLVSGYAVARLLDVHLAAWEPSGADSGGPSWMETIAAAGLAVLAPLALAFGAIVLAALLAGGGRRFAAGGAALLALVALPHLDAALAPLPLPYAERGTPFTAAFQATALLPAPGPAAVTAVELAALLLLVVGLCARHAERAEPGSRSHQ